jgi:hypothetical protein
VVFAEQRQSSEISNGYPLIRDYDTSVAIGGPIKRDRLWFFSVARAWQKDAWARQQDRIWDNANAGIWGQNYQPDRSTPPLQLLNWTRNGNTRITAQVTPKNKVNFFWDGDTPARIRATAPWRRGPRETAGGRVRCIRPG